MKPIISDEVQTGMINAYLAGANLKEAGRAFGHSQKACTAALFRRGIPLRRQGHRKHKFNQSYFSIIDSEEKAYWLGFITADGNVNTPTSGRGSARVTVELSSRDEDHLLKFLQGIDADTIKIKKRINNNGKPASAVYLNSIEMVGDLANLGVLSRKTFTVKPWIGPEHLMRHYWRGVVDGDGCVYIGKNQTSLSMVGNRWMASGFQSFLKSYTGSSRRISPIKASPDIFTAGVCGKDVVAKAVQILYGGATVYLSRKFNKARALYVAEH